MADKQPKAALQRGPETRDWLKLPEDVLSVVFQKLGGIEVLWPAQAVCRTWRQLALQPQTWRCIDMRDHHLLNRVVRDALTRTAVDRSGGHIQEFYAEYFCNDELLQYITERSTGLKVLVLISTRDVSGKGLVEFVRRCPLLEELEINTFNLGREGTFAAIGQTLPELKRFRFNTVFFKLPKDKDKDNAHAIEVAENMSQLQELQLIGNLLTNDGLHAILDRCIHLDSLDIRACLNLELDDTLMEKLAKVRKVRLPDDSTEDYGFLTGAEFYGFEFIYGDSYRARIASFLSICQHKW